VVHHPEDDRRATVAPGETYDHLHVVTAGWNRWLHVHPRAANAVLIASSLCVDAVTLFVLVRAVLGPSFTAFWGLLALFIMRQLSQAAVALPPPPGIIWRAPGFPSLFVTYWCRQRFFLLGPHRARGLRRDAARHTADPAVTIAGIVVAILQVVAVIALRAHWTMDVIAGLAAAIAVGLLF
jgi:hypothetical protein